MCVTVVAALALSLSHITYHPAAAAGGERRGEGGGGGKPPRYMQAVPLELHSELMCGTAITYICMTKAYIEDFAVCSMQVCR